MIKRILIILFFFMLIAFIVVWFLNGGVNRIKNASSRYTNPVDLILGIGNSGSFFKLPWQPALTQGPDISGYAQEADAQNQDTGSNLSDLQDQYDTLTARANQMQTFGNPSPLAGTVTLSGSSGATEGDVNDEHIELSANPANTAPVSLSGWSLQSAATGIRTPIPPAASTFFMGIVNASAAPTLNPGAHALVVTGVSPVGISFRENICTGYLQQFQRFSPELDSSCPSPSNALPQTPENMQRYGPECIDYVRSLSSCTFPSVSLPSNLSFACRSFIINTFSYNGCVQMYRSRAGFALDSWRIYLGSGVELWRNTHDIIRLLDSSGRTVDVMTY